MNRINILPPSLANKIAAGEVVQRPANALKELLENAIDAGAKHITILIGDSGRALIQVIDDGMGMNNEDAILAFERHATSKISSYEDLEQIITFGFRGEALASISAVSQVELRTRLHDSPVGTRVRIDGGVTVNVEEDAPPPGTSVAVKNLFFNTPGRRNFLKTNTTEFKHIVDVVNRAALSHPEIAFSFHHQEELIFNLRASSLEERILAIFGKNLFSSLFHFEHQGDMIHLAGFLGKPAYARKTRTEQYLFLNNRSIFNKTVSAAVFSAYEHLLEKGSFPFFVLFLTLDPKRFDINVHPSKMEVKFADDQFMYRSVFSAVRNALSTSDLVPQMGSRESGEQTGDGFRMQFISPRESGINQEIAGWRELLRGRDFDPNRPMSDPGSAGIDATTERTLFGGQGELIGSNPESDAARGQSLQRLFDVLTGKFWQVHNKYIIIPVGEGVMIVDQHAAHERVLYEKAIARFTESKAQTQQLLFPLTIEMNPGDAALTREVFPLLEGLGFSIKMFGASTVIVDGVPVDIKKKDENSILSNLLDTFKENEQEMKLEPRERLAKVYSCKAAIKSGDPLNEQEIRGLLEQLFSTTLPFTCPHGRPAIVTLSLSELDRRFGRTPVI